MPDTPKKIAILGLMLESNAFAPVTTEADFQSRVLLTGEEILPTSRVANRSCRPRSAALLGEMDLAAAWAPVPVLVGLVEAGGPLEHGFFRRCYEEMRRRLRPRCRSTGCISRTTAR